MKQYELVKVIKRTRGKIRTLVSNGKTGFSVAVEKNDLVHCLEATFQDTDETFLIVSETHELTADRNVCYEAA